MGRFIPIGSIMNEIFVELDGGVVGADGRPGQVTKEIGRSKEQQQQNGTNSGLGVRLRQRAHTVAV